MFDKGISVNQLIFASNLFWRVENNANISCREYVRFGFFNNELL